MIFVTVDRSERPLFTGFVNGVTDRQMPNGGTIRNYIIGTSERKQDDTREYSSWICNMIGNARKESESNPLNKGDRIAVYGFKLTNISRKNDDGTYGKAFLNVNISDYTSMNNQNTSNASENVENDDENPF